ncbi:MAG TPA: DUF1697 domain-containing protein [Burkholderiaceae bacterium]|nr:DUF1697 domain-containing protein [Burkholderiaceae bacterium]
MKTYVALIRGINVIGKNPLPMKELVVLLENIGARKVRTYGQSGTAIFQITRKSALQIAAQLKEQIERRLGFSPHVLILGLEAVEKAIAQNPFPEANEAPGSLHLGFLVATPTSPDLNKLDALRTAGERFHLTSHVFYLHTPEGVTRSKVPANAEKLLGVPMTYRNWKTVCKIKAMASAIAHAIRR